MNQWFGEKSGGSRYRTERWDQLLEISAETGEADARPKGATQRQQRLRRARRAYIIHAEAVGVTQKPRGCAEPQ